MLASTVDRLQRTVVDRRGRRVVFVSHCLLNENVRYLGGACRPGPIGEWLRRWEGEGAGICQMPCPEQRAWGGVLKRAIAPAFGANRSALWPLRRVILAVFVAYTRTRYRFMARRIAAEADDYRRSGYTIEAVVGVAGSPSCGVTSTLDARAWLEAVGRLAPEDADAAAVNQAVVGSLRPGRGWFMSALLAQMARRSIEPPLGEHDLPGELRQAID